MKTLLLFLLMLPAVGKAQSGIINTIAGDSIEGFAGDRGLAIYAEFDHIQCIAFDHSGNLYLADVDNNVIRKINTFGVVTTVAGSGIAYGYEGDGGPATASLLSSPTGIAFGAGGDLYIADDGNAVIRKINSAGIITTIAGNGTPGNSGNGGMATSAELNSPFGIAVDNSGNIYFSEPANHWVRKINTSGIITAIAGTGTAGYTGDGSQATAANLTYPGYLTVSSSADIYIPDWPNHCVRMVNASGIITTVAGNGTLGNSGDGGFATAAELNAPGAVNLDDSGNFYICDGNANVVRKVNTSGIITTIAGNDTMGFSGDGGPPIDAEFDAPACVIFNAAGNMFIADDYNNRIRKVTYHPEAVNNLVIVQNSISIYPNPTNNELTIKSVDKIVRIEILNLIGQEVASPRPCFDKRSMTGGREVLLDVSHLPGGVYFVKVNGVYAGKFVRE